MIKQLIEMDEVELAYYNGFVHGLATYAINKDGQQLVGSQGKTLREAQQNAQEAWNYSPPKKVEKH